MLMGAKKLTPEWPILDGQMSRGLKGSSTPKRSFFSPRPLDWGIVPGLKFSQGKAVAKGFHPKVRERVVIGAVELGWFVPSSVRSQNLRRKGRFRQWQFPQP